MRPLLIITSVTLLLASCARPAAPVALPGASSSSETFTSASQKRPLLPYPIARGAERITKKPFGIHVTPSSSPIQPERFAGYHTGTDFETFPGEQMSLVPIVAVCDGVVRSVRRVNGYGGVLIQDCTLQGQPVTVLYGHLRESSITVIVGHYLKIGQTLGALGTGYTSETDNERKHLHLSVHRGIAISYKGYVDTEQELGAWINAYPEPQ